MKLNKEFFNIGNQKKEINSFIVILLWINTFTSAIPAIDLLDQITTSNNVITPIISLIFIFAAIIGFVLMIQVKKSGLYIVFTAMFLQILYSLFSEIINEKLIIRNITVLIIWSCLLFLKKNGISAWSAYLYSPSKNNFSIENDVEKSPKWLEFTVLALTGVVALFIFYSIFIYMT